VVQIKKVTIYGAGISGLVAAINLAKAGFEVTVFERRDCIGGSPKWHPSVHQQTFNLDRTSKYIDIDLSLGFQPVKKHTFYFYGRKVEIEKPKNSYVCEKGPQSSSIENHLYSEAKKIGVEFIFGESFNLRRGLSSGASEVSPCIVATGLEIEAYRLLEIKYKLVQGFRGSRRSDNGGGHAISFFGDYTNRDFAYVATFGDMMFSLLFAREGVMGKDLEIFKHRLLESEGILFNNWEFSNGCVPLETNLVKSGVVLAGTISGMMDPFFLNGISGALVSGKLAAMFFLDKERALIEFNRFTKNFPIRQFFRLVATKIPLKIILFPIIVRMSNYFKWVGVL
jgi:flavin-dependent dehydrogenase